MNYKITKTSLTITKKLYILLFGLVLAALLSACDAEESTCFPNCDYDLAMTGVCYRIYESTGKITISGIIRNMGTQTVDFLSNPDSSGSVVVSGVVGSGRSQRWPVELKGLKLEPGETLVTDSIQLLFSRRNQYRSFLIEVVYPDDQHNPNNIYQEFSSTMTGAQLKEMENQYECPSPWGGEEVKVIEYNQPFALQLGNHGYIKYESRDYGINLGWSDTPSYEWEFRREGMSGPVRVEDSVGLFNSIANDYLVYS